jgi:hypothetical protein
MAAGLGFKDFTTGEVLTAADVDGYLMQGMWVFDDATARDAAVTSPEEGNFAFLKDTNVTTYYTGSAWANLDTTGMVNPMTTTGDTIYSSSGSTPARLGIGGTGDVLTVAGGVPTWAAPASGSRSYAVFQDVKAISTAGGTFTTGAWRTRDLQTTQINNITSASLASNQVTLPAGTYFISGNAPAYSIFRHYTRFQNITDSTTAIVGTIEFTSTGNQVVTRSWIIGQFTIASSKVFEFQHRSSDTKAGDGFGTSEDNQLGGVQTNIYANVTIEKIG